MGIRLTGNTSTQVWARKLADAAVAVALLNRGDGTGEAKDITVHFDMTGINLYGEVDVFDIWSKKAVGRFSGNYTAKAVPFHGTAFLRFSAVGSGEVAVV